MAFAPVSVAASNLAAAGAEVAAVVVVATFAEIKVAAEDQGYHKQGLRSILEDKSHKPGLPDKPK